MPRTRAPSVAYDYLERLGETMQWRGWQVALTTTALGPVLTLADPGPPRVTETVVCRQATDRTWHYVWGPEMNRVGSVVRLQFVATRIHRESRGVAS